MRGRVELPNLYGLSDVDKAGNNFDTSAKKRIYPDITGAGIFVTIGQSRIANNSASGSTPYTVLNGANCINLNPYDGCYYIANDPVLGCSASAGYMNAGWHGRLCDKLITATKYTKVVVIPIATAGSSVTEWDSGGPYRDRIRAASAMLTAMNITPTAWLWQQGLTDANAGMTQATYQTALRSIIAYQRSLSGRSADKWMIAQASVGGAANTTSAAIRAAQAAVAGDANNFLGPDTDTLTYPTNSDGTHYNDTGNDAVAGLWSTEIQAAF
jgi:hypothetical protein